MPAVGLDISDDAVSVLELVRHKQEFAVGRFGRRVFPRGSISGGYIHDKDAVVGEIRKLKDALKLDFVNASLSEEKAYLFETKIPRVTRKEIRGVLEFKLEENVPIAASEAIFDYTLIAAPGHEPGDSITAGVTVLPKKVVETYSELLNDAGLVPLSFEIEAQAISRAVIEKGDRGTYLLVNFGESKTGLFIVSNEVVHFTSTVSIGGVHITQAIAKYLSVSIEEAGRIKHEYASFKNKKNSNLFLSLMNVVSALKDEINKLSVYWRTHQCSDGVLGHKIHQIVLCGRDAGLEGFADYLALAFENTVVVGNVWQNVFSLGDYVPPLGLDDSLDFAAAVGLALPKGH